jgi:chaperonin GroEL (HSP60 family)
VVDTLAEGVRNLSFDINPDEIETIMSKGSCCLKKLKEMFSKYSSEKNSSALSIMMLKVVATTLRTGIIEQNNCTD